MSATDLGRRELLAGKLAAGFALAVQPITAETIATDSQGLTAGEVDIPAGDRQIPAYRAMPANGKSLATILVVQEIFGVHEHIKDVCRRFAKAGYLAVAPEMYVRQGDVSKLESIDAIVKTVVSKVPDAQVMSDLDATANWSAKNGGDGSRIGVTGFCWGGRIVWLYSAHSSKVKAGVAWYGRLSGTTNELTPKYPIDVVGEMKAPVLGLYGGKDQGIPVDVVEKFRAALKNGSTAAKASEIELYLEAPHGFYADYRNSYREKEAKDAWQRALAWFERYGVTGKTRA